MARPQKNNADYFSHDNNMRNDKKLKAVRTLYGLEGYAVYCMLLESITEADLLYLKWDELEIEMISGDFGVTAEKLKKMVDYFVKINLIVINNNQLFCPQLDKRLACVFEKRTKNLDCLRNENGVSVTKNGVCEAENPQSKVKKSKVKKISSAKDADGYTQLFLSFWDKQIKKVGKGKAFTEWKKACKRRNAHEIIAAWEAQSPRYEQRAGNGVAEVPHPATWLSQSRWDDELDSIAKKAWDE